MTLNDELSRFCFVFSSLQTTKSIRRQGIPRRGTGKRGGRVEASRISMLSSEEDLQSLVSIVCAL